MKKYFSWFCFVAGVTYLGSLTWKVANNTIVVVIGTLFYFWSKWK